MADLFIMRRQTRLALWFLGAGIVGFLLAAWHFYSQLEYGEEHNKYLFSLISSGVLAVGWLGLFIFYLSTSRARSVKHIVDVFDRIPWRAVQFVILVLVIGVTGVFVYRYADHLESGFDLLRDGDLVVLGQRLEENPALMKQLNTEDGASLVQVAFQENRPEAVGLLLKKGASRENLDLRGRNPVTLSLNNLPMLRVLLDAGFDPKSAGSDGVLPLHQAIAMKLEDTVALLLDAGVNVNQADRQYQTPLMVAAESGALSMIDPLVKCGADVNAFDRRGDTPLHKAVRYNNNSMVQLLLEHAADPTIFNFTHMTPMHIAARDGNNELVSVFLKRPDILELCDESERTPFDYALKSRKYKTAKLLMEHGADINRQLVNGDTLLHRLLMDKPDIPAIRFLLSEGARVDIKNIKGKTAFDLLREKELDYLINIEDEPEDSSGLLESGEILQDGFSK